jgi:dihydrofolate synthase/folylpolyglutamate synthase
MPTSPLSPAWRSIMSITWEPLEEIGRRRRASSARRFRDCAAATLRSLRAGRRDRRQVVAHGIDYDFTARDGQWSYRGPGGTRHGLPIPALRGTYQLANAATALAALDVLRDRLAIGMGAIREGLVSVELPGRLQVLPGRPVTVLDVAHNQAALPSGAVPDRWDFIRGHLQCSASWPTRTSAASSRVVAARGLLVHRGPASTSWRDGFRLAHATGELRVARDICPRSRPAYRAAREAVTEADRIIVFGSFLTVAAVLALADRRAA